MSLYLHYNTIHVDFLNAYVNLFCSPTLTLLLTNNQKAYVKYNLYETNLGQTLHMKSTNIFMSKIRFKWHCWHEILPNPIFKSRYNFKKHVLDTSSNTPVCLVNLLYLTCILIINTKCKRKVHFSSFN